MSAHKVCFDFDRNKEAQPWTLASYRQRDGYQAWENVVKNKIPQEDIIDTVKASSLRGRGGAGFPTGLK